MSQDNQNKITPLISEHNIAAEQNKGHCILLI